MMSQQTVNFLLIFFGVYFLSSLAQLKKPWIYMPPYGWDKQWKQGVWNYLETNPNEKSRLAVIGHVFIPTYSSVNASVLDVGCGAGILYEYLDPSRQEHYLGMDISKAAIAKAYKKQPKAQFTVAITHEFVPDRKFDVIVFSEVLNYVEHEKVLQQYEQYLSPAGVIIISLYFKEENHPPVKVILEYTKSHFEVLEEMQIIGFVKREPNAEAKDKVLNHIVVVHSKQQKQ